MHVPKDERSKLDAKTRQCIFLGYDDEKWGYKCYDPVDKKVLRSRDVVFLEDQTVENFEDGDKLDAHIRDLPSFELSHDVEKTRPHVASDSDSDDDAPQGQAVGHGNNSEADLGNNIEADFEVQQEDGNQQNQETEVLRRSTREKISSSKYPATEYVLLTDCGEPVCYKEALEDAHKK